MFCWSESEQYFDSANALPGVVEGRDAVNAYLATGVQQGGVLLIGINKFARFNNMYSYEMGDRILEELSQQLQACCPDGAELYRMGGAKFLYLCRTYTEEEIRKLYYDLVEEVRRIYVSDISVRIKLSGGLLLFDYPYQSSDDVYRYLERALKLSKNDGRGILKLASREEWEQYVYNLQLREELLRCVENDCEGFEMYFQPIMTGDGKSLYSCEALMRWKNEKFPNV